MKSSDVQNRSGRPGLSRRKFMVSGGAAAAAITLVPRHVLGGPGFVAPSEKITLAQIGCGTQGLREMPALLSMPQVQIVAVCDPVKESHEYVDWSSDGLRTDLARARLETRRSGHPWRKRGGKGCDRNGLRISTGFGKIPRMRNLFGLS